LERGAERRIADRYAMRVPPLGHGGMGVVWRAEDTLLGREVAIKEVRLPPSLTAEERARIRARVMREARVAARLNHPGAVILHDIVEEDGRPFIVMELVPAPTLSELVGAEGPLPPARAAAIGLRLLDTLEAAHRVGIVHRDVKPSNVMVCEDGSTKLADFGIASLQGDPAVTASGLLVGSPAYMAPEQADQGPVGPPTDLWALGATLYFAVEGEPPFDRGGPVPTLAAVVHEEPRPMRQAGPLEPALAALLRKSSADRLTAPELRRLLRRAAGGSGSAGAPQAAAAGPARAAGARTEQPTTGGVTGRLAPAPPRQAAPAPTGPPGPARTPAASRRPRRLAAALVTVIVALLGLVGWRAATTSGLLGGQPAPPAGTVPPAAPRWQPYQDPKQFFRLEHPPGWTVVPGGKGAWVDFRKPHDPVAKFRVQVDGDTLDPLTAWTTTEAAFVAAGHEGYRRIALARTAFEPSSGGEPIRAARWEFTYVKDGQPVHVWDLSLVTRRRRYAVLWQTGTADWAASTGLRDRFLRTFEPLA
jgi:tRNA A-37 threonylcarbamoyl transferase component Bud32